MSTTLSIPGTVTASFPLLAQLPAGVAAKGDWTMDRCQADAVRIECDALFRRSSVKRAAPRPERVRLPHAAPVVALTLASEGS